MCCDEAEHHWPHPKSLRSFRTDCWHCRQFRVISSLKNSTGFPQFGHSTSNMASAPQSWVLFPVHFLIGIQSPLVDVDYASPFCLDPRFTRIGFIIYVCEYWPQTRVLQKQVPAFNPVHILVCRHNFMDCIPFLLKLGSATILQPP